MFIEGIRVSPSAEERKEMDREGRERDLHPHLELKNKINYDKLLVFILAGGNDVMLYYSHSIL